MKKVLSLVVALGLTWLICVHLSHEVLVDGYRQGCYDTIQEAAKDQHIEVSDQIVKEYCAAMSERYVGKR